MARCTCGSPYLYPLQFVTGGCIHYCSSSCLCCSSSSPHLVQCIFTLSLHAAVFHLRLSSLLQFILPVLQYWLPLTCSYFLYGTLSVPIVQVHFRILHWYAVMQIYNPILYDRTATVPHRLAALLPHSAHSFVAILLHSSEICEIWVLFYSCRPNVEAQLTDVKLPLKCNGSWSFRCAFIFEPCLLLGHFLLPSARGWGLARGKGTYC